MERAVHVLAERLVGFLLDETTLSPAEHSHLMKCDVCQEVLVSRVSDELAKRLDSATSEETF
jgi:hypothetical protein